MKKLLEKIEKYDINNFIKIEESDLQYISLKKMYDNIKNKEFYLPLIVANSIICYQLSSSWENYREEFSKKSTDFFENSYDSWKKEDIKNIISFFKEFLPNSRWNKRFVDTKIKRLEKLKPFLEEFLWKQKYYYENMTELRNNLAKTMNQKIDAKTIVFAVKMFSYGARNYFWELIEFPFDISIPIDSRLINLFEIYKEDCDNVNEFYKELSLKTKIAPLHLDAILWVNYNKLI